MFEKNVLTLQCKNKTTTKNIKDMNEKEIKVFGTLTEMFGEGVSKTIYNLYVDFIHDMKMFGLIFSYPFKFVEFWKDSYKKLNEKK